MIGKYLFILFFTVLFIAGCVEENIHRSVVESETYLFTGVVDSRQFPLIQIRLLAESSMGEPVEGLLEDEIVIEEDSAPVKLLDFKSLIDKPVTTALVIDTSGSMEEEGKLEMAQEASVDFINMMKPEDRIGIISFNREVYVNQEFTDEKELLTGKIFSLEAANSTALYDAAMKAIDLMKSVKGDKSVILLTDGLNRTGVITDPQSVVDNSSGVRIFTIGLGSSEKTINREVLEYMAGATGGKAFFTPQGNELSQLYTSIARQMQFEYFFEYRASGSRDGFNRDLTITIDNEGNIYRVEASYNPGGIIPVSEKATLAKRGYDPTWRIFSFILTTLMVLLFMPKAFSGSSHIVGSLKFNFFSVQSLNKSSPYIDTICPYENSEEFPISMEFCKKIVICPQCGAVHHIDCWIANNHTCSACSRFVKVFGFHING